MKQTIQTTLKNRASSVSKDVVGLEIGTNFPQGTPAVRIHVNKNQTELLAAGFVKLNDNIPLVPEAAAAESSPWSLPKKFQAPKAAIAVSSAQATLRQSSGPLTDDPVEIPQRRRDFVTEKYMPPLVASIPDFVASWIAGRFAEGHSPTTRSIQASASAALNCFLAGPIPRESSAPAITVFCFQNRSSIAAFFDGNLILYREHPIGYMTIREEISRSMNIDMPMVDSLMDDPVVDISSIIDPLLNALFRQIDISSDYLARRKNCSIDNFYVYGLPCGVKLWTKTFKSMMKKPLCHLHPFGGISCSSKRLVLPEGFERDAPLFMSAIGAARALLEDL